MHKVFFYVWRLELGHGDLVKRIILALQRLVGEEIDANVVEIASYGDVFHKEGWGVAFDCIRKVTDETDGQLIELPNLNLLNKIPTNKQYREGAVESLEMLAKAMTGYVEPEPTKAEVQTQEGYTISKEDTDFTLSDADIEYIKKVRDLLKCSKVVLKKGDLTVELS